MMKKMSALVLATALFMGALTGCSTGADPVVEKDAVEEATKEVTTETKSVSEETDDVAELTQFDKYFVSAEWLHKSLNEENIVVIDARGPKAYEKGHIEGARVVAWQGLSKMDVEFATEGWGTLKDADAMSEAISALGLTKDSEVIVYADALNGWGEEGRILWTLQAAGIENVKMLDGGVDAWNNSGYDMTKTEVEFQTSDYKVDQMNLELSIDTETLVNNYDDFKIIDTRALDEFEGAQKFGEARGGHLPDALWLSYKDLMEADGTLKTVDELEKVFVNVGLSKEDKIVTYCTAGIRSAYFAEILKMLGYDNVVNYDDSYYVWANKPELKVGRVVKEKAYKYYDETQVKTAIESNSEMMLIDIQPTDDFAKHQIVGAIGTDAYPVKSEEDKAKLDLKLDTILAGSEDVVIICPRGGGGAERTYQYLESKGVPQNRLFILEGGQADWSFEALLVQ